MSIESKHAYRFGYLKSEQWQSVRLEALAREGGKCQICGEESISNDAHHIWYPDNIYQTTSRHLAVLCRPCHDLLHVLLPECKHNDEERGMHEWLKFQQAVGFWIHRKRERFQEDGAPVDVTPRRLRDALKLMTKKRQETLNLLGRYKQRFGVQKEWEKAVDMNL